MGSFHSSRNRLSERVEWTTLPCRGRCHNHTNLFFGGTLHSRKHGSKEGLMGRDSRSDAMESRYRS